MVADNLLLHQALELPPSQRARLANALLASLEANENVEFAWDAEIHRRLEGFRAGSATLASSEDLLQSLLTSPSPIFP
jgi:putative addiction module component (TIGR02574 family)